MRWARVPSSLHSHALALPARLPLRRTQIYLRLDGTSSSFWTGRLRRSHTGCASAATLRSLACGQTYLDSLPRGFERDPLTLTRGLGPLNALWTRLLNDLNMTAHVVSSMHVLSLELLPSYPVLVQRGLASHNAFVAVGHLV